MKDASAAVSRADESIAKSFTRMMRAATSPIGVLTDPPIIGAALSVLAMVAGVLYRIEAVGASGLPVLYALVAAPLVVTAVANAALFGARAHVVAWLASVPFPLENVNALLNGVGQNLVVRFAAEPPERGALNARLDEVHPDCFALEYHPEEPEVEVRIGVLDSKLNPAGANHRRYLRVQRIVERCLVPLHDEHRIERVRVC